MESIVECTWEIISRKLKTPVTVNTYTYIYIYIYMYTYTHTCIHYTRLVYSIY